MIKIISILLILFALVCVSVASEISRIEFNTTIDQLTTENRLDHEKIESKIDNFKDAQQLSSVAISSLISKNTEAISSLSKVLNRVQDMLEKIFLLMIGSVFSALLGGIGMGMTYSKRKAVKRDIA